MKKNNISRKEFLSYGAAIGATAAMGGVGSILTSCSSKSSEPQYAPLKAAGEYYVPNLPDKAPDGKELRVGLVGCGGRGSGAVQNVLNAANGITVTALADVFPDKVEGVRNMLKNDRKIDIPEANCYVGFDAYKKLMDSGVVDMVLLCTPPVFRPEHFKYAVEKGLHSFMEKPISVDPAGYRTIVAAAKQADAKGLSVITGTQRHHQRSYVEAYKKVMEGYIGEITGGNVYWNQNMLWYREKDPKWTDTEWMIRDWVNWTWLSGDHIVEQHVHNIDVFMWFSGLKPVKATGVGSRQRRITGDQYDNFSIDFEFENGIHLHSMCRQIDGCSSNVSEFIQGTKGSLYLDSGNNAVIKDLAGNVIWEYDKEAAKAAFQQHDPYTLEHVNWIEHIRSGKPFNQAVETAQSSLAGTMGRQAAYTGQTIAWADFSGDPMNLLPADLKLENRDMSQYKVPVPGTGK